MNDFYMYINVNQDECYMLLFIKTTDEWEGLTPSPIFLFELFYSFILFLFIFYENLWRYVSNQIIVHILILSECYY